MLAQRRRRWANVVEMLYKCCVFAGSPSQIPANMKHWSNVVLMQCRGNVVDGESPINVSCFAGAAHPAEWVINQRRRIDLARRRYSTDFTKWDRFFISGWPALTLASPSLARAQARRDRRRIGCAQRMKWARAPTRFGPGKYTRPNSTWACTQYTVWRLTWMLWTMCHLAGLARLALGKTGRAQLDHIQHHLNSSELI